MLTLEVINPVVRYTELKKSIGTLIMAMIEENPTEVENNIKSPASVAQV